MNRLLFRALSVCLVLAFLTSQAFAGEKDELTGEVAGAIKRFKGVDEHMAGLFESAAGYVVFPKVAKGGLGLGGARGKGQVFDAGRLVGEARLTQFTVGLQAGGQVYSEVIFFENSEALEDFKEGDFEFSAQVSAVAAAEGASKNAKYEHGVLIFTLAGKGLMLEASVGGQKFDFEPYEDDGDESKEEEK